MEKSNEALKVLGGIEGLEEEVSRSWVSWLVAEGHDPAVWAEAFAYRAKRIETPTKFLAWMLREGKSADVLGAAVEVAKKKAIHRLSRGWPYPKGRQSCKTCSQAAGWYPVAADRETTEQLEAIDAHEAQGAEPLRELGCTIFLCLECNPSGEMEQEFQKFRYKAYPVGSKVPAAFRVETL